MLSKNGMSFRRAQMTGDDFSYASLHGGGTPVLAKAFMNVESRFKLQSAIGRYRSFDAPGRFGWPSV